MSHLKLLDLNNDWQQERPSAQLIYTPTPKFRRDGFYNLHKYLISGYQKYSISSKEIIPLSENTKQKLSLIKNFIHNDVYGKTVSDVGCSNMFFGLLSHYYGATKVTGVDLDLEYIKQNSHIIDFFKLKNIVCKNINAVDYKEVADTVFAFAIMHWVYSCSGFLGSLENVVKHFRSITKNTLYIEWIDPTDDCIADMLHHLDFNKNLTTQDYNKDNFIKYLKDNFSSVDFLGTSKKSGTREIYRCVVD